MNEDVINVMPTDLLIAEVKRICIENNVKHLTLIGSFATGTQTLRSDMDFAVYGCEDYMKLEEEIDSIETLRKIDLFDADRICNEYLLEDIAKYGKPIY